MIKINKVGIILFIISSILSLVLLEIGLRVAGTTFNNSRMNTYIAKSNGPNYDSERDYELFKVKNPANVKQIWAIGDSFTNAGNVTSDESYPAQLFSILEQEEYNYDVVNLGQCEDPTWGSYQRLKALLESSTEKPEIIIFLVGVSDPFHYLFNTTAPVEREKQHVVEFKTEKSWVESLRIYKVYRHIKLNWISREISQSGNKLTEEKLKSLEKIYNDIKANKNNVDWKLIEEQLEIVLGSYREFLDGSINELKFKDKIRLVSNGIITPLIRGYTGRLNYNKALEVYLSFIKDFPEYFWDDNRNGLNSLHTISQIMMFQSKYTGEELVEIINNSTQSNLEQRESKLFKQALRIFDKRDKIEKFVNAERLKTWNEIIKLQKEYKFEIVLQTYASEFNNINRVIKTISKNNNFALNDNNLKFKKYIKKYGRENIFADDNHFQPVGYRLMAEELYELLKNEKLIMKN